MRLVLPTRQIVRATPRSRIIQFDLGDNPFAFTAGQAVMVGLPNSPVRRPYSIACSPRQAADGRMLEQLVQLDDIDTPDPHVERLTPGALVEVDGPFGTFGLPEEMGEKDILFVAGGTGIAPLRSMMWDAIERGRANRIALIYSARSANEFAHQKELERLAAKGRVDVRMTVTREGVGGWMGPRGRIDAKLIQSILRTTETQCALCGPPAMISDVTALLIAAGVSEEKLLAETFKTDTGTKL